MILDIFCCKSRTFVVFGIRARGLKLSTVIFLNISYLKDVHYHMTPSFSYEMKSLVLCKNEGLIFYKKFVSYNTGRSYCCSNQEILLFIQLELNLSIRSVLGVHLAAIIRGYVGSEAFADQDNESKASLFRGRMKDILQ